MKIGIMGAMREEVEAIKNKLVVSHTENSGRREYTIGLLHEIETVLVFSRWGKVAASSTATALISQYKVDLILFVGAAGALDPVLNIGDVVIGENLYQHDMDARPLFKKHEIPLTTRKLFASDIRLVEKTQKAATTFLANLANNFSVVTLNKFAIHEPKVLLGKIATGDQFVNHPQKISELKNDVPDVLAVEMEGAAVAQVCSEYDIPFVVIRIISDKSDHNAFPDSQAFINEIIRNYSCGIIEEIFKSGIVPITKEL